MSAPETPSLLRRTAAPIVHRARSARRRLATEVTVAASRFGRADVALFHEFAPSPTGGAHQFLRALVGEFERRGLAVEQNRFSAATPACLFNSFNFDFERLRRLARIGSTMVHRVDGPIAAYRGWDDGTDDRIAQLNEELATATVFQSQYSLAEHRRRGYELVAPVVIPNAVDPSIFHPPDARAPLAGRKIRLIATSWSDNPNKGGDTYRWLGRNLDPARYELTFVGQAPPGLEGARVIAPVRSHELAALLRAHDVYIAASLNDPCSNALLEALACGLPALHALSGGHPELVGEAGLAFSSNDELLTRLEQFDDEYARRRGAIRVPALADVATKYLDVLEVAR